MLTRGLIILTSSIALLVSAPAAAQNNAEKAGAQVKFEEATRLMAQKKYKEACARFEESLRLSEAMAARFRLAECYEKAGQIASAWINYVNVADAAGIARLPDRERVAKSRAQALKPRLMMLTIKVPKAIADLQGIEIRRDDVIAGPELWNAPAPVDPGEHQVRVSAPGKRPWSGAAVAEREGSTVELSVGPLIDEAKAEVEPSPMAAPPPTQATPGKPQRIVGLSAAGVGTAAVIAGVVVGLFARRSYDRSAPHCVNDFCDPEGLRIRGAAREQGTVATVVVVVGAAVAVTGGVLWLTAPSATRAKTAIGVGPGNINLRGVW